MQQRVGLARVLVNKPRVLLMDEPFSSLDAQTRLMMQELLLHVWSEYRMSVLFVTHDIDEAVFLGSRVAVLTRRPGRLKALFDIDLPRPRAVDVLVSTEFMRLKRICMDLVREETLGLQRGDGETRTKLTCIATYSSQNRLTRPFRNYAIPKTNGSMSKILNEVIAANRKYAKTFGDKASLALPPARHFAILNAWTPDLIQPERASAKATPMSFRNAGGRASDDAIRSLVISYKLLGTREWFVIHHAKVLQISPRVREVLRTDIQAAFDGDPAALGHDEIILSYPFIEAIAIQRLAHRLHRFGAPLIPRMMTEWAHGRTGIDIHPGAVIGTHFFIDHGRGWSWGKPAVLAAT